MREVAEGPTGALLAGEQVSTRGERRLVALKVFASAVDHDSLRGALEAHRRLRHLSHRHLVAAHGLARVDGQVALVSPWVEGIDLLDWVEILRETGVHMPGRVICEILRSVAVALDAALCRVPWGDSHPLGLVHRDLKPTNILISRDGEVKVVDFACGYTSLAAHDARTGALRNGLTKYRAPERREGLRGQAPGDVYALGILGIELFRHRWLRRLRSSNPAHDRHLAEVVAAMGDPDMRSQADTRALRTLLLRMVAFDPEHRPSAVEVAQTLRTLADRAPGASLESFAHDHALPYVEPPAPRVASPPPAELIDDAALEDDDPTVSPLPQPRSSPPADLAHRAVHDEEMEGRSQIIETYTDQAIEAVRARRGPTWRARVARAPQLQSTPPAPRRVPLLAIAVATIALTTGGLILLVAGALLGLALA